MPVRAVCFDIGETIVDETRHWAEWADWLGVPRLTFFAVLGAIIARSGSHIEIFEHFGTDFRTELSRRAAARRLFHFGESDLYPDARPCLAALRADGHTVALAGNQPAGMEDVLRGLDLPVDVIGTSAGWRVEKPSAGFFERVAFECGVAAEEVVYVGDRVDNDVRPAAKAGMRTALVRRGPWGHIQTGPDDVGIADFHISRLTELPPLLAPR